MVTFCWAATTSSSVAGAAGGAGGRRRFMLTGGGQTSRWSTSVKQLQARRGYKVNLYTGEDGDPIYTGEDGLSGS